MAEDITPPEPYQLQPGDRVIQVHDGAVAGTVMEAGVIVQVKPDGWGHNRSKYYLPEQLALVPAEPPK